MAPHKTDNPYRQAPLIWTAALVLSLANTYCADDPRQFGGSSGSGGSETEPVAGADAAPSSGGRETEGDRPSSGGGGAGAGPTAGSTVGASAGSGGSSGSQGSGDGGQPSGGEGGGGSDPGDATAPEVLTVTPEGKGIAKDAPVVVTFSEAMAASSAQAVTLELDGQPVALSAGVWSDGGKRLTLEPVADLGYAVGTNPNLVAKSYTVKVATSATDLAGNALPAAVSQTFSTLRQIETVVLVSEQRSYFDAESSYTNGASSSFYIAHQVGGDGYETQYNYGLVAFAKSNQALVSALADAQTFALELYGQTAATGVSLKLSHVDAEDIESSLAPYATVETTSTTTTSFPAANSWWSFDVRSIFTHASFNLASYGSLQFALALTATSTVGGTYKSIQFAGGTHAQNKPRLRFTKLVP